MLKNLLILIMLVIWLLPTIFIAAAYVGVNDRRGYCEKEIAEEVGTKTVYENGECVIRGYPKQ